MKEQLRWWVRVLARLRRMAADHKAKKEALYNQWKETDLFRKWDRARLDEKRAEALSQKAAVRVRDLRIRMFDGRFKGKILGIAIRMSKPKPRLYYKAECAGELKKWMWENARVHLQINEEALLKMVLEGIVPDDLAWAGFIGLKVTATIARDLDKELEA